MLVIRRRKLLLESPEECEKSFVLILAVCHCGRLMEMNGGALLMVLLEEHLRYGAVKQLWEKQCSRSPYQSTTFGLVLKDDFTHFHGMDGE